MYDAAYPFSDCEGHEFHNFNRTHYIGSVDHFASNLYSNEVLLLIYETFERYRVHDKHCEVLL